MKILILKKYDIKKKCEQLEKQSKNKKAESKKQTLKEGNKTVWVLNSEGRGEIII